MRTTVFIVILTLVVCAASVAQAPTGVAQAAQAPIPEDPGAKKARAILNQMIQTMGGEAFLTYSDMSQAGRTAAFYHGVPSSSSVRYWLFWKWPDMERVEFTKQRDVIYIHNGDKGYETTYKGTRPEEPEELKSYVRSHQYSVQVVLRRWLKEPGTVMFYDGTGIADQKQVDKVTIMNAKNQSVTFSIDSFSHLLVRKSYQWRETDTRYINEEAEIYGNYHSVQGIQTPRSLVNTHNGDVTRQRFIDTTTYNNGLPDAKFEATVTYDPLLKKSR